MFNYLTPIIYWMLIILWSAILWFCIKRLRHKKIASALFATILVILTIDALRTLFESVYFGAWYSSIAGILPSSVYRFLMRPELVFIPKLVNLAAAILIVLLLRSKWLPQEEEEQSRTDKHLREKEEQSEKQRQTETALHESEEQFRNIVEATPMGIHQYELGPDGELVFTGANPAADTILGIDHNELAGKSILEAFPALEFTEIPDRYKEICTTGRPWQTEDIHYKDGHIAGAFQVHAFQTLPGRMAAQFLDITERKRTDEKLHMTQFAVDNAAISIFWLTFDGTITYVNNAACEMLGYRRDELLSMNVAELTPDSSVRPMVLKKIKADRHMTFDIKISTRTGDIISAEITSHYIHFGDQEFEFSFVVDQTQRKQAEKALEDLNRNLEMLTIERTRDLQNKAVELEEANMRLNDVDRLKSALLSSVTHELKTPLTSIIGYTKLTERDFSRDIIPLLSGNTSLARRGRRIEENLSVIGQESTKLLGLIDNFLALSKIRSGAGTGSMQPLDVAEIIKRATGLSLSYFSSQPNISLEVDMAEGLPTVQADPNNLVQVIVNLLDNAAKFAGQGVVQLRSGLTGKGMVYISVSDDGPGIPESDRDKVFEPFHQVCQDEDCTIKPQGAGTGLSICKHIVEHYGGTIRLECPDSGGSIFIVELPVDNGTGSD